MGILKRIVQQKMKDYFRMTGMDSGVVLLRDTLVSPVIVYKVYCMYCMQMCLYRHDAAIVHTS